MKVRWQVRSAEEGQIGDLARQLEVPRLVAGMLVARGLCDPDQAWAFLNPRLEDLHDPSLLKGVDGAVARILQARDRGQPILIYGDYDVDGITSTVVLKKALEMLGASVDYYLPRRLEEGYGLQVEVIKKAAEEGYRLIITADSGIRAFEACDAARQLGVDLIITDHHLPDAELPQAFAIVNPRQPGCQYPEKHLAAVGVVFKLVQALFRGTARERAVPHFLKLVAIGTIADLVPLTGENRIIAKFGLQGLSEPHNVGLKALLQGAGVSREVDQFDVGFKVAPRINAVTRMGGGREVVDLFSVADSTVAESIVEEMNRMNVLRREEEDRILAEISERVQENPEDFRKNFLLVSGRDWHRGVIGIVASRLVERFYRPVLVLSIGDSTCQGSGRSIPGFHLLEALDSCRDAFSKYGGHAQAVGCTLDAGGFNQNLVDELSRRLDTYAGRELEEAQLVPSLEIDTLLPVEELSLSLYSQVQRLAPFGAGNPVPLFASRAVDVVAGPWTLKDRHLKMRIQGNGSAVEAIWWGHAEMAEAVSPGSRLDLAYSLDRNAYLGEEKLTLTIQDMRLSAENTDFMKRGN